MKQVKNYVYFIVVIAIMFACSTQKNSFVNRSFHSVTTKYNVLFNGEQAYEKGLEEIRNKHEDNFWKRLQIEPITFDENSIETPKFTPTTNKEEESSKNLTPFEKAEEKAVKAIQKHSMYIGGFERNGQIDDAYLLLGKARYYTQRFVPALEAFNYVIANYPQADLIYETKIWRAKTNIRIANEKRAIETLRLLLDVLDAKEKINSRTKEEAYTAMAMAYEKTDTIKKVIDYLKLATQTHYNKEQTARNMFILGQIYSELNLKDSARIEFQKLVDFRRAPSKYHIHANIELAKNTPKDSSSTLIRPFEKLIKNRDNRPYLDELYYQIGVLEENRDSVKKAISYYKKSLQAKNGSDYQKTYTYEKLGNAYFKKANFILANSYYDSVMKVTSDEYKNEKRIRRIERKHKSLILLSKYETQLKTNDSILHIANLSKEEQKQYFEKYIAEIKNQDTQLKSNPNFSGNSFSNNTIKNTNKQGKWYFYNDQAKTIGQAKFAKIWGNRPLEDNWRWSDKILNNTTLNNTNTVASGNKKDELANYLNAVPKSKKVIDSLTTERNEALYQLGLIYKEQFKNTSLAIQNLERLAQVNTDKNLDLPINYHLYQIYSEINNPKANQYKNVILTKYPKSKFAQIILNPNKDVTTATLEDDIAKTYEKIYYLYKKDRFEEVVLKVNETIPSIQGSELIPKFELLKAYALGKYKSKEEFKKAMEFVALTYANTVEGEKAREIAKQLE
ncbi:tetratricopeptide repeat protein [Tenacibaculum sp. UWU-22]|uniref:type IX secretion system periplasmic lipoprotein PorW/SprE n=1 Tax=Tenacibaculum sp. UWU-22 TaxID=3234187 RepID=UPI0034DB6BD5